MLLTRYGALQVEDERLSATWLVVGHRGLLNRQDVQRRVR
jgi:hypothetical protein